MAKLILVKGNRTNTQDRFKHLSPGFASATAKLAPGEDPEKFRALIDGLMREFQPATPTERILVENMAQNRWLSLRAVRLQNSGLTSPKDISLAIRYQTASDRGFNLARATLLKAQKERKKSEIGFARKPAVKPTH